MIRPVRRQSTLLDRLRLSTFIKCMVGKLLEKMHMPADTEFAMTAARINFGRLASAVSKSDRENLTNDAHSFNQTLLDAGFISREQFKQLNSELELAFRAHILP